MEHYFRAGIFSRELQLISIPPQKPVLEAISLLSGWLKRKEQVRKQFYKSRKTTISLACVNLNDFPDAAQATID